MELIDTPHLQLRSMRESDEALYCALYTDPQLMRHIAAPLSVEAARRSFRVACEQAAERPMRKPWWVIHERATGNDLGVIGLSHEDDSAELGIVLGQAGQGRGIAAEAMVALVARAFATGFARRLWLRHEPDNAAMAHVAQRLGWVRGEDGDGPACCRWWLRAPTRPGDAVSRMAVEAESR